MQACALLHFATLLSEEGQLLWEFRRVIHGAPERTYSHRRERENKQQLKLQRLFLKREFSKVNLKMNQRDFKVQSKAWL